MVVNPQRMICFLSNAMKSWSWQSHAISFADDKLAMLLAILRNPGTKYLSMARDIFPVPFRVEKRS